MTIRTSISVTKPTKKRLKKCLKDKKSMTVRKQEDLIKKWLRKEGY